MLAMIIGCAISWNLEYNVHSFWHSHESQRTYELRCTKKGTRTITKYVFRIKACIDGLITIIASISENEHLSYILEGLLEQYNSFVTLIHMRTELYIITKFENHVVAQEVRITNMARPIIIEPLTTNVVDTSPRPTKGISFIVIFLQFSLTLINLIWEFSFQRLNWKKKSNWEENYL